MSECYHCGLPLDPDYPISTEINGESRDFCCIGCQSVCVAIHDAGLAGFYNRTPEGSLLSPPPEPPKDIKLYDLDEVQEEFVTHLDKPGDERSIHLLVEGIHCAACVWLIENSLLPLPGVISAAVNLSGKRLHLSWDNQTIKLSDVIQTLGNIGYAAVPFDLEASDGAIKRQNRSLLFRIAFSGFTMMNLLWVSIALYSGADEGDFRSLFQWVGFALATPTLFYSGWPFLKGAYLGIRHLYLTMDMPIAIGATVTWAYSSWVTIFSISNGHVYFDTVVNFIFVILIGRYLEAVSKRHAVAATQRLMDLQPKIATLLRDGVEALVPVRTVKPGDIVIVKSGYKIPVDGCISDGETRIDESMLTGETEAVSRSVGDSVSAGTINQQNPILVEVTAILQNTALGRIIDLVEQAQASKAPIQCTADRIVPWFVAITLALATATFIYWLGTGVEFALMSATSVLIITCPCAFGLATPMAIAVASGQGARHGILIKNGTVLEMLSSINHFVFDKTGTLTEGKMQLTKMLLADNCDPDELLRHVAAIESRSQHPIAKALQNAAEQKGLSIKALRLSDIEDVSGDGIRGKVDDREIVIGKVAWLKQLDIILDDQLCEQAEHLEKQAVTAIHIAENGQHLAVFGVSDQLREGAKQLVQGLLADGIKVTMLSGDRCSVAEAVAVSLGGQINVIAEVRPEQKHEQIQLIQQSGDTVAMVGDGVNDAPALIQADVGIAIGSGTDVSIDSADIVLMNDELDKIHLAEKLSRRTLKTIRQNIGISITYNIIMVPLAMSGFITPLIAAISMPISSLLVIGNAARIRTLFRSK